MELKEGMYVRTKGGYIRKIDRVWDDTHFNVDKVYYNNNIYEDTLGCILDEDIIGEPSYNIIDLIEVGDYVNGIYIEENNGKYLKTLEDDMENSRLGHIECIKIYPNDIKSIVTKEQFSKMEYKVGE